MRLKWVLSHAQDQTMSRKAATSLQSMDLNLLLVMRKLLETRSASRAAAALSLTPSAISHSLARLREVLGDELFLRTSSGLIPTQRALEIEQDLLAGLSSLEKALFSGREFDPRTSTSIFRLATTDYGAQHLLPKLLQQLNTQAPGVQVLVRPLPVDIEGSLTSGEIDAMIGIYSGDSPHIHRRILFTEKTQVLARQGHPAVHKGAMSLSNYLAQGHVLISPRGKPGSRVDDSLHLLGHSRRIAVMVPDFLLAPHLIAETDFLLTAGDRLLFSAVKYLPVQVLACPYSLPPFDVYLNWHARRHEDPAFRWFRQELLRLHEELYLS
jgi:DNA-binding transcriptional LysR family regulator